MQKNSKMTWDTRTVVFLGLLVAMHIVLSRLIVIDLGSYRIGVASICTILAGLWMGPVAGGVVGLLADLLGCLIKGYALNPLITIAAMAWGVIPGLIRPLVTGGKVKKTIMICVGVFAAAIFSTLVFTTAGLVLILGYNFYAIIPGRIAQWSIMTPIYCVLTCMMYFSPLTHLVCSTALRRENRVA